MAPVRLSLIAASAVALGLSGMLAAPAMAAVGRPAIPHASGPFKIGPSSSPGTVALTSNGGRVAVFDIASGHGKTRVCLISATGRSCFHSTLLSPPASDFTFGTPGVFVPSANHVVVLQNTCCDSNPNSTVLYTSTNGGKNFSAPVRVGSLGVDASELIGTQLLFTEQTNSSGLQVVSVPLSASAPGATATISTRATNAVGVGQYKGGALVGTDNASGSATYLYYAAKGKNFDLASSYHQVATFSGESLLGMSGSALLTNKSKGNKVLLRIFNGSSFGPARTVAHVHGGIGTWFTVNQDPIGHVHVFAIMQSALYQLLEVSTSNGGKTWTSAARLGNGINSVYLSAALSAKGKGLVLGNTPAWGYPVP